MKYPRLGNTITYSKKWIFHMVIKKDKLSTYES